MIRGNVIKLMVFVLFVLVVTRLDAAGSEQDRKVSIFGDKILRIITKTRTERHVGPAGSPFAGQANNLRITSLSLVAEGQVAGKDIATTLWEREDSELAVEGDRNVPPSSLVIHDVAVDRDRILILHSNARNLSLDAISLTAAGDTKPLWTIQVHGINAFWSIATAKLVPLKEELYIMASVFSDNKTALWRVAENKVEELKMAPAANR